MGELKLYGMKSAYDEIITTVRRQSRWMSATIRMDAARVRAKVGRSPAVG